VPRERVAATGAGNKGACWLFVTSLAKLTSAASRIPWAEHARGWPAWTRCTCEMSSFVGGGKDDEDNDDDDDDDEDDDDGPSSALPKRRATLCLMSLSLHMPRTTRTASRGYVALTFLVSCSSARGLWPTSSTTRTEPGAGRGAVAGEAVWGAEAVTSSSSKRHGGRDEMPSTMAALRMGGGQGRKAAELAPLVAPPLERACHRTAANQWPTSGPPL